jgi:hypothetical protein
MKPTLELEIPTRVEKERMTTRHKARWGAGANLGAGVIVVSAHIIFVSWRKHEWTLFKISENLTSLHSSG